MAVFTAYYVDGKSATRTQVRVIAAMREIVISTPPGAPIARWPYEQVTVVPDERTRGPVRLAFGTQRLTVDDPGFAKILYAQAPHLAPPAPPRRVLRTVVATALSLGVVAGFWWSLPWITEAAVDLIPPSAEVRLGENEMASVGIDRCTGMSGQGALDHLVKRLTDHADLRFSVEALVDDDPQVNAFAFPGGRIVLLRGLLAAAKTPDEVAGVLAHEITHTRKRHPLRHLVATAGIEVFSEALLGYSRTGDIGAFMAGLTYSRAEEAEADAGAIELLRAAGIGTEGFADFFERMSHGIESAIPPYLSNHPTPQARLDAVRAASSKGATPALSAIEWNDLQHICDKSGEKPKPKPMGQPPQK